MIWKRTSPYSGASGEWVIIGDYIYKNTSRPVYAYLLNFRGNFIGFPCKDSAKAAAKLLQGAVETWEMTA